MYRWMEVGIRERKEFPNERVGDVGLRSYYGGIYYYCYCYRLSSLSIETQSIESIESM